MATVVPVPADVRLQSGGSVQSVQAGEAIQAGDFFYISTVDNKAYLSDATASAEAYVNGIALSPAALDELFTATTGGGAVDLGTPLVNGELYVVSTTAGSIMPYADLVATDWITWACLGDVNGHATIFHKAIGVQKV